MNAGSPSEHDEGVSSGGFLSEIRSGGAVDEGEVPSGLNLSGARAKRRISMTNAVLVLVLVVSAGSLYLMRWQGKGAGMTFQVSRIDYELEKSPGADGDQQRILAELARTHSGPLVPAEPIQKNPFQIESDRPLPPPLVHDTDLDRRRRAERRDQEISSRLASLELNGVMGGSTPLARISGQTVRVGDTLFDVFVVAAINPDSRSVELMVDQQVHTLSMGGAGEAPRRPGSPRR